MIIDYIDRSTVGFCEDKEKSLLNGFEKKGIKIDSLLFSKGGKIFYEKYFGIADSGRGVDIPNSEYTLNRMFSICKSFTAIAIGLLIDEGKLNLNDKIADYYNLLTGKNPENAIYDDGIRKTTIEDMLTTRTPHKKTTYKTDVSNNWVDSFFTVPSDKEPGGEFDYDTSATHVLCALVEKMTGLDMLDYIKKKMPELELSDESYIMKDPFGTSTGGTGLMCTTKDLYRFALLIANKGRVPGSERQLVSSEFINSAVSKHVDTSAQNRYPFMTKGYGYYFWMGENGGYLCYGMRGQFICFLPDKDLILIATSDCSNAVGGEQMLLDLLCNIVEK